MTFERFKTGFEPLYERAIGLYETNFIVDERRDADEQRRVLSDSHYHCNAFMNDAKEMVGIVFYWESDTFVYLEHLCIEESYRGMGYGSAALEMLKALGKTVILEIEPVIDEITAKRRSFYEKNGFYLNPHLHIQPKYHVGDEDLILWIMSLGREISTKEYADFYKFLKECIQIQPVMTQDVVIEPLTKSEDIATSAELIYYSDNYIYPYFCFGVERGRKIISEMILTDTIYNKKNITLAKHNGIVVGAMVSLKTPFSYEKSEYIKAIQNAGAEYNDRCERVWNEYYALLGKQKDGTYIANICVSSRYRGNGIAKILMSSIFENDRKFFLECVQKNCSAIKCYQKLGFEIVEGYPGFTGIPCYKMIKYK